MHSLKWRASYHEAGHAVVAHAFGLSYGRLYIRVPVPLFKEHGGCDDLRWIATGAVGSNVPGEDAAAILMAGDAATLLWGGVEWGKTGADFQLGYRLLLEQSWADHQAEAFLEERKEYSRAILTARRIALDALAVELFNRHELLRSESTELLNRHFEADVAPR